MRRVTALLFIIMLSDFVRLCKIESCYLVLRPCPAVLMIVPSDRTTSKLRTFSLIVPYLTALVPEALVAAIPHKLASAPGSNRYRINYNINYINHAFYLHGLPSEITFFVATWSTNIIHVHILCHETRFSIIHCKELRPQTIKSFRHCNHGSRMIEGTYQLQQLRSQSTT